MALVGFGALTKRASLAQSVDATSGTLVLTPEMTEGPYWIDERLNRADLIVDPTDNSVQAGLPLVLTIRVYQVANQTVTALPGAYVDLWHCNASGLYSDEAANNTVGQKWLRGYQASDTQGKVRFLTIYPGWYRGRTPHIHCRVRVLSGGSLTYNFTTQFFFDEAITDTVYATAPYSSRTGRDTLNSTDMIYTATDCMTGSQEGSETMLTLAAQQTYAVARVNVKLNLSLPNNSTC